MMKMLQRMKQGMMKILQRMKQGMMKIRQWITQGVMRMIQVNDIPNVRRSTRPRKQRININHEEIGDCDDKNDPDYK